ncbi:SlyX family protein [Teredinibacter waterburyi]|uniref:SlyX family protein n=1 Tax=Teredinibacter waterburyi TaxID=1500538 RepID=UPI00165FFA02|nr:SlyX family protein [Teredinibacter waterburyi]
MSENLEAIEDLQARMAFQDDTIGALNDQIAKLSGEVVSLQQQLRELYKKLDEVAYEMEQGKTGASAGNEPPPHY